jgi:group I intron endonuclease
MSIFIDTFPVLVAFGDLHLIENLESAKDALNGESGIYAFVHIETGTSYIGSSLDLGGRIMNHILGHSSNQHLQYAIAKYGLSSFAFVILQYCIPSDLLKLEQYFLDILFSLAKELRYNFSPTAGSSLGVVRSEETRAKMSDSQQLVDRSGANHPMYGKVPANAFPGRVDPIILCMVKFLLMP